MDNKPDPKLIGAFTAGAILLLIAMIVFFSSNQLFTKRINYVLLFDQSVQGLSVGSTVKLRGVPIGSVTEITIRIEGQPETSTAIPVVIEIDYDRIMKRLTPGDGAMDLEEAELWIPNNLVAKLDLESFITGQAFIELTYRGESSGGEPKRIGEMFVIPTEAGSIEEITADVAEVIASLNDIDFERLNENINVVLENLAVSIEELTVVLKGVDSEGISESVKEASRAVTEFADSKEFREAVVAVRDAFRELSELSASINDQSGPLGETIADLRDRVSSVSANLNEMIGNVNELIAPSGEFQYELQYTLRQLARAANSLRETAEYLEYNPKALLTGRAEEKSE